MSTYLGALIFGIPLWILLYYHRKDLRHKMLYMSLLVTIVSPFDTLFIPEYWHPVTFGNLLGLPVDIFTLLFGFVLGGIAAVLYEELMKRSYMRARKQQHPLRRLIVLGPLTLLLLKQFTLFNFMVSVLIASTVMVVVIIAVRRDLFLDTFFSGLFFALVYSSLLSIYIYIFPEVLTAWNLEKFPQTLVGNIPHYEIAWAFVTGAFLGPLYEFSHDFILRKLPSG